MESTVKYGHVKIFTYKPKFIYGENTEANSGNTQKKVSLGIKFLYV